MNLHTLLFTIAQDALWSGVAALGFAMLFNVPRRALWGCLIAGAVGHAVRTTLMQYGVSIELATLAGATVIGFLSVWLSQRFNIPSSIYGITGVIPMVPGKFAYSTMIGLLRVAEAGADTPPDVLLDMSVNAIKTALLLGALALGVAAPRLLFGRRDRIPGN